MIDYDSLLGMTLTLCDWRFWPSRKFVFPTVEVVDLSTVMWSCWEMTGLVPMAKLLVYHRNCYMQWDLHRFTMKMYQEQSLNLFEAPVCRCFTVSLRLWSTSCDWLQHHQLMGGLSHGSRVLTCCNHPVLGKFHHDRKTKNESTETQQWWWLDDG